MRRHPSTAPSFYLHVAKKTYHHILNLLSLPWLCLESPSSIQLALSTLIAWGASTLALAILTDQLARKVNIYQHLFENLLLVFWLQSSFALKNTWFDYIKCLSPWTCVKWFFNFMGSVYHWLFRSIAVVTAASISLLYMALQYRMAFFVSRNDLWREARRSCSFLFLTYKQSSRNIWHCIWARLHHKFQKRTNPNYAQPKQQKLVCQEKE